MGAAIVSMFFAFLRGLPGWVLVVGAVVLFYEGIPPIPISLPFIGEISIIDGRVDNVRRAAARKAEAECERQKIESRRLADQADKIIRDAAVQEKQEQLDHAEQRAEGEAAARAAAEEEISRLEPELRKCRLATDADIRRLRNR